MRNEPKWPKKIKKKVKLLINILLNVKHVVIKLLQICSSHFVGLDICSCTKVEGITNIPPKTNTLHNECIMIMIMSTTLTTCSSNSHGLYTTETFNSYDFCTWSPKTAHFGALESTLNCCWYFSTNIIIVDILNAQSDGFKHPPFYKEHWSYFSNSFFTSTRCS